MICQPKHRTTSPCANTKSIDWRVVLSMASLSSIRIDRWRLKGPAGPKTMLSTDESDDCCLITSSCRACYLSSTAQCQHWITHTAPPARQGDSDDGPAGAGPRQALSLSRSGRPELRAEPRPMRIKLPVSLGRSGRLQVGSERHR